MPLKLPTDKSMNAMKCVDYLQLYYGAPGVGKTTFVSNLADRVLFLSTDRGTRTIETMRVEVNKWEDFIEVMEQLDARGAPTYDMVCVDHVYDMALMCESYVCSELKVESLSDEKLAWGVGWKRLKTEIHRFIHGIMNLDIGVVFISHEQVKEIKLGGLKRDYIQPAIPKSTGDVIIPMMGVIGHCSIQRIKDDEGKKHDVRAIRTDPGKELLAKDRSNRKRTKEEYEPLDGKRFAQTFITEAPTTTQRSSRRINK